MESSSLFSLELVAFFAVVYTLPGWLMALLTRGVRAKLSLDKEGKKEDNSASQVVRLTNRTIASTAMYIWPFMLLMRNLDTWSPWSGGAWDSPMDETQRALLHMQLMYYVMDMPYTLLKHDTEQVIHHVIGFGLAVPTVLLGKCGLVMCAILFTEQGSSIWVRYTKMQRYFLPRYNPLERLLVLLNFVQNIIFFFTVNTPLLLRVSHEILFGTGIPITGPGKYVLGGAVALQLVYDAYWTTRLWNSYWAYQAKMKLKAKGAKAK